MSAGRYRDEQIDDLDPALKYLGVPRTRHSGRPRDSRGLNPLGVELARDIG